MTTLAKIGWGCTVHMGTDAMALTKLSEITAIALPDDQIDMVEATHFESEGARREYIAGLIESGEGEFAMNYIAGGATDALIRTTRDAREAVFYKIVLPVEGGTWEITGQWLIMGYTRDVPLEDRRVSTMSVKFTGEHAEAAGA